MKISLHKNVGRVGMDLHLHRVRILVLGVTLEVIVTALL